MKNINDKINYLEDRTFQIAMRNPVYGNRLSKNTGVIEDLNQAIQSTGAIEVNYREVKDSLSTKDFRISMKITQKGATESTYFLPSINDTNPGGTGKEAIELKMIMSSILSKSI